MQELIVDFITSLDGYGAAEGWPGWWGLEGPEYLGWLAQQPERNYTILMGANTYRLMSGLGAETPDEDAAMAELTEASKVVFSSTLQPPFSWPNTRLVSGDVVEAVPDRRGDVGRAGAPGDDRGPLVDHGVPDSPCLLVGAVTGQKHLTLEPRTERP